MAKSCPKCKETECEECPEWIFTLADLIMCMMGLFVILWVLKPSGNPAQGNSDDNKAYVKMAAAIRDAFGYIPNPNSTDPVDIELLAQKLKGDNLPKGPGDGGRTSLDNKGTEGEDDQVRTIRVGKESAIGTAVAFEPGSATISDDGIKQIKQIAEAVRGRRYILIVRGHTSLDDLPETSTETDRLDLSLVRARMVAEALAAEGIDRQILRVQGASTYEPAKRRRFTPDAQAANRRVEIASTDQLVEDRQDRPPTTPTAPSTPAPKPPGGH